MSQLTIQGTTFLLNGQSFEYMGLSFFNAMFNDQFSRERYAPARPRPQHL